ncbi:hypothetical protein [Streptomyces sp. 8N706]|uniref:hypothetical protein n=1 Tax=Streptomyces sp. 8N706 TaxID=3457416 RepID=UPI003FD34284
MSPGPDRIPAGRVARRFVAPVLAAIWCWAVLRLVAQPAEAGPVEAVVAAGGWGLSLLPVHCVPKTAAAGAGGAAAAGVARRVARAWRRRRWDAGSGMVNDAASAAGYRTALRDGPGFGDPRQR